MATKFRFVYPPIMAASLILALLLPVGSPAQEEGQWRLDTVVSVGKDPKLPTNVLPGEDVKGWWWLPITNENLLIQHMNDEYESLDPPYPQELIPDLWVFPANRSGVAIDPLQMDTTGNAGGHPIQDFPAEVSGIALIETENYVVVIGSAPTGEVYFLKNWIKDNIKKADNTSKPVRYLVLPDVNQEGYWYDWLTPGSPGTVLPLTVIESSALPDAMLARQQVSPWTVNPPTSIGERNLNIYGLYMPRDTNWRLNAPIYAKSSGACSLPGQPTIPGLDCLVIQGEEQTVNLDGLVFRFINVLDEIGGLATYVPDMETLVPPSLFDGHLPNTAPLQYPVIPILKVIAAVDLMRTLDISYYFPLRGHPLVGDLEDGRSTGAAYLDATWTVLNWIHAYTVNGLRNNQSFDQIVTAATIPDWAQAYCIEDFLPMSPCGEFENSLASIVKGVYAEYMGWFDGTARSLSAHVTSADRANLFLEVAGDMDGLLKVAESMTAAADDLASIERAMYLVEPLHELALSPKIDAMYFQLLWKAGMLQTANDLRNYYLSLAWRHNPYW